MKDKAHIALSTFSIKDIETITGIKAHTIRIWEQRYKLLQPKRTDTNIRYYDDEDLRYILNVSVLNNNGYRISDIAGMDRKTVQEKVLELTEKASLHSNQIKALIAAMFSLDEVAFNRILSYNILRMGLEDCMIHVVFPFLHQIGVLWLTGAIHPAHEHFITNLIRQKLFVAIDGQTGKTYPGAKRFLLFLPEGEPHEVGLLFANYLLRSRGHDVVYLGQNLPFSDLQHVFDFYEPEYVMSALTTGIREEEIREFIHKLTSVWPDATIFLTGYQILSRPELEIPDNVVVIRDMMHLKSELDRIRAHVA